jgi:hypothetical protein
VLQDSNCSHLQQLLGAEELLLELEVVGALMKVVAQPR